MYDITYFTYYLVDLLVFLKMAGAEESFNGVGFVCPSAEMEVKIPEKDISKLTGFEACLESKIFSKEECFLIKDIVSEYIRKEEEIGHIGPGKNNNM